MGKQIMRSTVELTDLEITPSLGTYGPDDVVPDAQRIPTHLTLGQTKAWEQQDAEKNPAYKEM